MKTNTNISTQWEQNLLLRATQGESVAFELLVDMYRPALMKLAMKMLRNSEDANDAVQETIIKAFRAIHEFDASRPLKPWLYRICANCCVDTVRLRRKGSDSLDDHEYMLQDQGESLEDTAVNNISSGVIQVAILRLPKKYQQIILMRHFKHMDVIEIARELKKPEGTIKSWLFRARAMLKKDLGVAIG